MALSPILPELERITREAGKIAQAARQAPIRELKPDGSIVTNGDREVQAFLDKALPALVSGTTYWGEEGEFHEPGPNGLWLADPVDGTSNYSFGLPAWGVSIGLVRGNEVLFGAVILPDFNELYLSEKGQGVTLNGRRLERIPPAPILEHELVSYCGSVARMNQRMPGKMRCSGAFVYEGVNVATQRLRGLVGYREKLYDVAACCLFGEELGAEIRYADGAEFRYDELTCDKKIGKPWLMFPANSGFHMPWPIQS